MIGGVGMRNMLKVLVVIGIVVGVLLSVKLGIELWAKNVKKYFIVESNN